MGLLQGLTARLVNVVGLLPDAVGPGAFLSLIVLIAWVILRARRPFSTWLIRTIDIATDGLIGLLLLPEYLWTSHRRTRGLPPGSLALAGGGVAERTLDTAAKSYRDHPRAPLGSRPPLITCAVLCGLSIVLYLMIKHGSTDSGSAARQVWAKWGDLQAWATGASGH